MRTRISRTAATVAALAALSMAMPAQAADAPAVSQANDDVLDRPAMQSPLAAKRLLLSMARAGERFVAVGPRGHIVVSSDGGQTWTQSSVPVSSDLTAVHFPSASHGWAVGHDGVVLSTTDGGKTWAKQLDGRAANDIIVADVTAKAAANPDSEVLKGLLAEAQRYKEEGPDKPFLDVWFENDSHGFVVGAYNLIFETSDGGKTWQSWFDRVANARFMNLYSIRPAAGGLYIAGEAGVVFRLDPVTQKFESVAVDYGGSFFAVVDAGDAVLVAGLKGNVFRTTDGGKSWSKVDAKLPATVVSGATLGPGKVVLVDQGGRLAVSQDAGQTFELVKLEKTVPLTSVIDAGGGRLGLTGPFGAKVIAPGAP
ncbi:MAG: glycosyl hydrolase [Gammaproteobacteria bacterium]|nr:glycosyl hydrolase [Gammaproteobacteria bacterium]